MKDVRGGFDLTTKDGDPVFQFDGFLSALKRKERRSLIISVVLWVATFLSCTLAGFFWHAEYVLSVSGGDGASPLSSHPWEVLHGLPYATALVLILLAHEMGHYLACRRHGVSSTPPYPIPFPIPVFPSFGTMGAFIKIRSPFLDRVQLFDVGVAGPLAGMAVCLPVFVVGLALSAPYRALDAHGVYYVFGDSAVTWGLISLFFPTDAPVALHPLGWAAMFGFLATSVNLLPIGQLDGGHIVYALFGRSWHRIISWACWAALVGVSAYALARYRTTVGYLPFAVVLLFLRVRHPPTLEDSTPPGPFRFKLGLLALIVFLATFIPVPIYILEI